MKTAAGENGFCFQGAEQKLKKNVEIDNSEPVLLFLEYIDSCLIKHTRLYGFNIHVKYQTFFICSSLVSLYDKQD